MIRAAVRLVACLSAAVSFVAACQTGDGYQVMVNNRSATDLVMVFSGSRFSWVGGDPDPAARGFLVKAGMTEAIGPEMQLVEPDWRSGHVSLLTVDCTLLRTFDVEPGSHVITMTETGEVGIEPYVEANHFPPGLTPLPIASPGCP